MKFKSFISKILVFIMTLTIISTCQNAVSVKADSFKVVTLGADLTEEQKSQMLKYFNVTENDANILTITSAEEYEALGNVATSAQLGTRAISCSYVEPTSEGGLDIKSNNLTWVTVGMIRNALITAGIENAKVVVSAPFKVSGTAALTGVLKGFENSSSGEKIDEEIDLKSEEILIDTLDYSVKEIEKVKKNKFLIILLTIIITIFSIILLDTIQAVAFKNSPIISWRVKDVNDSDSYVDKGFLIDTYYCVKEQDIVTVIPTFKNTNYNCPSE